MLSKLDIKMCFFCLSTSIIIVWIVCLSSIPLHASCKFLLALRFSITALGTTYISIALVFALSKFLVIHYTIWMYVAIYPTLCGSYNHIRDHGFIGTETICYEASVLKLALISYIVHILQMCINTVHILCVYNVSLQCYCNVNWEFFY